MNKSIENWLSQIKENHIAGPDIERSLAYAKDLERGLSIVRTYPQGVAVFGSARLPETDKHYIKARKLGQLLAQNGHSVVTGGGPGIMEAANRGAFEYGGRSIGLNITLPHEQHPNPYLTDTLEFHYFFARKVMLLMSAKVYVLFPGGFGTMDELSEVMILMTQNKMPKMPIFLVGRSFWRPLDRFFRSRLLANKMIKPSELKVYQITDDLKKIVAAANKIGHLPTSENLYDDFNGV